MYIPLPFCQRDGITVKTGEFVLNIHTLRKGKIFIPVLIVARCKSQILQAQYNFSKKSYQLLSKSNTIVIKNETREFYLYLFLFIVINGSNIYFNQVTESPLWLSLIMKKYNQ
jgi:hypothetical protein